MKSNIAEACSKTLERAGKRNITPPLGGPRVEKVLEKAAWRPLRAGFPPHSTKTTRLMECGGNRRATPLSGVAVSKAPVRERPDVLVPGSFLKSGVAR